jgi:uncharacterized protein (TIGR02145 family)
MKRDLFLMFAAAALMTTACREPQDNDTPSGPAEWAECNVDEPGTFVENSEDYGRLYTFKEAQTACPEGWRVPTENEFKLLVAEGNDRETRNGVNGRRFGSGNKAVFFPAAGRKNPPQHDHTTVGTHGYYWSSTALNSRQGYQLYFHENEVDGGGHTTYNIGCSVRCVRR